MDLGKLKGVSRQRKTIEKGAPQGDLGNVWRRKGLGHLIAEPNAKACPGSKFTRELRGAALLSGYQRTEQLFVFAKGQVSAIRSSTEFPSQYVRPGHGKGSALTSQKGGTESCIPYKHDTSIRPAVHTESD